MVPDELEGGRTAAGAVLEVARGGGLFVVGEDPTPHAIAGGLRLEGVQSRLREAGLPPAEVVPCLWDVRDAFETVDAWLGSGVRPTALVCLNDRVAMGAYQALAEHGLRIPDDVAVVSFDGSELASWLRPQVTSVALPFAELGALAVELLMAGDEGDGGDGAELVRVPMPLSVGGSVRSTARSRGLTPTPRGADAPRMSAWRDETRVTAGCSRPTRRP